MIAAALANVFNPICLLLIWFGTVLGIIFGCMGSLIAGKFLLNGMILWPDQGIVLGAFLFSVVLGVIFGMYPAVKASGLQPVVALRAE